MLRDRTSTLVKVTSLSVGLICFSIISLFVYHEFSYDGFHNDPNQVYRVVKDFVNDDGSINSGCQSSYRSITSFNSSSVI